MRGLRALSPESPDCGFCGESKRSCSERYHTEILVVEQVLRQQSEIVFDLYYFRTDFVISFSVRYSVLSSFWKRLERQPFLGHKAPLSRADAASAAPPRRNLGQFRAGHGTPQNPVCWPLTSPDSLVSQTHEAISRPGAAQTASF